MTKTKKPLFGTWRTPILFEMVLTASCFWAGLLAAAAPPQPGAALPAAGAPPAFVKVAAIQCSSDLGEVKANCRKLAFLVEEAAKEGAKIIVLPEAAVTGYVSQDLQTNWHLQGRPLEPVFSGKNPLPFAEAVPGPSTKLFGNLAKKLQVYLTVPLVEIKTSIEKDKGDPGQVPPKEATKEAPQLFNTVCLLSPQGKIVAHYRKLTPWPHPEQSWASPGDRGIQCFDSEFGRMGLAICYDVHTILEKYKPRHLWALLYPIAWVDENHPAEWFWHTLPSRVRPFQHYVIGANWSVDQPQKWYGYGFSTIISPEGKVIASARSLHGSEIVYATIRTAATLPQSNK